MFALTAADAAAAVLSYETLWDQQLMLVVCIAGETGAVSVHVMIFSGSAGVRYCLGSQLASCLKRETFNLYRSLKRRTIPVRTSALFFGNFPHHFLSFPDFPGRFQFSEVAHSRRSHLHGFIVSISYSHQRRDRICN